MTMIRFDLLDRLGLSLSLIALSVLLSAALGARTGLWDYRTGFMLFRVSLALGLTGASLSAAGLFTVRGACLGFGIIGIFLGLAAAGIPYAWSLVAKTVPPIHDITTDWVDPPKFEAVLPLRQGSPNSAVYGGEEIAQRQRAAYPEIVPFLSPEKPEAAFTKAFNAAKGSGWEIVSADPAKNLIEATDKTFWFGFRDDIVVRIRPEGEGSRVDVRSVSRLGKSDIGKNAKRITNYLRKLKEVGQP